MKNKNIEQANESKKTAGHRYASGLKVKTHVRAGDPPTTTTYTTDDGPVGGVNWVRPPP